MEGTAARIQCIDHVGIAVPCVADAVDLYVDVLGGRFLHGGDNLDTGLRLVQFALGNFKVELMEPRRGDSLLAPWLDRHGPGIHHVTFIVDDLDATIRTFENERMPTVGTSRVSRRWQETFIHPGAASGALLQFVTTPVDWSVPSTDHTLAEVLAGEIVWEDYVACHRTDRGSATPTDGTPAW